MELRNLSVIVECIFIAGKSFKLMRCIQNKYVCFTIIDASICLSLSNHRKSAHNSESRSLLSLMNIICSNEASDNEFLYLFKIKLSVEKFRSETTSVGGTQNITEASLYNSCRETLAPDLRRESFEKLNSSSRISIDLEFVCMLS